jgi:hypothetical protein
MPLTSVSCLEADLAIGTLDAISALPWMPPAGADFRPLNPNFEADNLRVLLDVPPG